MQEYLRTDPCRLHRATARFLLHSAVMDAELRRAGEGMLQAPTTLLLAQRDRIIHNGRTVYAVNRLTGRRTKVLEIPAAHTMDFEPDPAAFFETLTNEVGLRREQP
jgi:alpha-beta hydrolase superfamily lysophospholipase